MRYVSLFSGMEAATAAWHPLGWTPLSFAEIDLAASSLLATRFPNVPNLGSVTRADFGDRVREIAAGQPVDLLVGGSPCQAFSVAGLRRSLNDARGNLMLRYAEICDDIDPRWIVWENVPGVLNTVDNAFGCLLGALSGHEEQIPAPDRRRWPSSGFVAGPKRVLAWRVMDAQFIGVPQRRRRVFVAAVRRGEGRPEEILFERPGLRGDSPAVGSPWEAHAGGASAGVAGLAIPIHDKASRGNISSGGNGVGIGMPGDPAPTLTTGDRHMVAYPVALTFRPGDLRTGAAGRPRSVSHIAGTLVANGKAGDQENHLVVGWDDLEYEVRRFTPTECLRLQGFPDWWFDGVLLNGKPIADGHKYRMCGNSMAVPVMRWIGEGIELWEAANRNRRAA